MFAQTAIKPKKIAYMTDINTTTMTGRLTRDPVVKNNGPPMGYFTLASNDRYRDKTGAVQTKTAFFRWFD